MSMNKKVWALLLGASVAVVLLVVGGGFLGGTEDARIERLKTLQVPADGAALFAFMLREIPEVVEKVPCVCCSELLAGCYQGACPPS